MESDTFGKLRLEVLTLYNAERAELAHELVSSLDTPSDENASDLWDREISSRLAEIDAGTARLIDRAELRKRLKARTDNV